MFRWDDFFNKFVNFIDNELKGANPVGQISVIVLARCAS